MEKEKYGIPFQEECSEKRAIYALEELSRWIRNIENSMWLISALLFAATGYAFKEFCVEYYNEKTYILIIAFFMIVLWYFYICLLKHISYQIQDYIKKAEFYERMLEINIFAHESKQIDCVTFLEYPFFPKWYHKTMNKKAILKLSLIDILFRIAIMQVVLWFLALLFRFVIIPYHREVCCLF
ncbi:hypothetical protein [Bergeyella zoohelcum]|uniref:Uncharacterized protein n=1 Tax=Bergeyella zoohelcum TaxID=1015 RepID=A0A380ZSS8_9FLAO|nr:hypothetical protein [Bergeyella zoohelcum]EKB61673.1 hypothetical protein HMPREF9700_00035 [Bergeyella zoohelcum CCUG 30536]SUV52381.1 Uncharacterised protein [Bergeyella zoohelcum]